MSKVIYPGTFDPITLGHVDLVQRALNIFDGVTIAIAENIRKKPAIDLDKRADLVREVFKNDSRVEITVFSGLLVDFAKEQGVKVMIRGLRAFSDFEMEFQLAAMNRQLDPEFETLFLMPAVEYQYISSSMVREVAQMGGDLSKFVPDVVANYLGSTGS